MTEISHLGGGQFRAGVAKPDLDHFFWICATSPQAPFKFFEGRGKDQDAHIVWINLVESAFAEDVQVQRHVFSARGGLVQEGARCAVEISVDLVPFCEFPGTDHGLEPFPGEEEVVHSVDLAGAWSARGCRDRIAQGGDLAHGDRDQRAFARTGRRGEDDELALPHLRASSFASDFLNRCSNASSSYNRSMWCLHRDRIRRTATDPATCRRSE